MERSVRNQKEAIKRREFLKTLVVASTLAGLGTVFYGQALIGSNLTHVTYTAPAESREAHTKQRHIFKAHPTWDKMKNHLEYSDTVSEIVNRFLVPTPFSQV